MKKYLPFALSLPFLVTLVFLSGCTEKYAANKAAADAWLSSKSGKATVHIAGSWVSREWGGGAIRFEQQGNQVTGVMGDYSVKGHVVGSRAYLQLISGNWVHYLVVLTKSGSQLSGFYSGSVPFDTKNQSAVNLYRIGN